MFLVIDALDEARVKANEASYEAFIRDIAGLARGGSHVSFVLLGRTQAAELTWLILEEEAVKSAFLEIEPFDRAHAELYIDRHISTKPRAASAVDRHRDSFEKARNTIFDRLIESIDRSTALPPSKTATAFTGYAPVLDAISVLLAGTLNFAQLNSKLISETPTVTPGSPSKFRAIQILANIVEDIIAREHSQKLVQNIKPALQALASQLGWSDWERLYLPQEQLERLVARLGQRPLTFMVQGMPAQIHAAYEAQVASWLPDHPFLRDGTVAANAVFESYLLAQALVAATGTVKEIAETILKNERYKPSRLLADFYMLFKVNEGSDRFPPEHIGILYDALASADTDAARVRLLVESPDDDDAASGVVADVEFEFVRATEQAVEILDSYELASFVSNNATISFRKTLRDALVRVPCSVELGSGASEFRIGPNVTVQCKSLILDVRHLTVDTHSRRPDITEGAVLLEAQECVSAVVDRPTVRGELQISWPGGNAYPWNEFYSPESGPSFRNSAVAAAYRRFRRIVMTLRSHSKGSLARYRHKIEHQRVLQGALGEALLNQLRRDKVLQLDDKFYHWNPERAAALVGISWQDLRRRQTSDLLTAYLESFLHSHPEFA